MNVFVGFVAIFVTSVSVRVLFVTSSNNVYVISLPIWFTFITRICICSFSSSSKLTISPTFIILLYSFGLTSNIIKIIPSCFCILLIISFSVIFVSSFVSTIRFNDSFVKRFIFIPDSSISTVFVVSIVFNFVNSKCSFNPVAIALYKLSFWFVSLFVYTIQSSSISPSFWESWSLT